MLTIYDDDLCGNWGESILHMVATSQATICGCRYECLLYCFDMFPNNFLFNNVKEGKWNV